DATPAAARACSTAAASSSRDPSSLVETTRTPMLVERDQQENTAAAGAHGRLAEIFVTFQGEGPHVGKRQVFLRLAGCEVGCRFCDTPDALRGGASFEVRRQLAASGDEEAVEIHANPATDDAIAAIVNDVARRHAPIHAIAITGGEPLEQPDFLAALVPRLAPHAILLETAGVHPEALERVLAASR